MNEFKNESQSKKAGSVPRYPLSHCISPGISYYGELRFAIVGKDQKLLPLAEMWKMILLFYMVTIQVSCMLHDKDELTLEG